MKYLLLPLLLATFVACQDGTAQDQQGAASGPVTGAIDRSARLVQGPGLQPGVSPMIVRMGSAEVEQGTIACLPVEVSNFQDMIGFQYTMAYDSAALRFVRTQAYGLAGYSAGNFGTRFADRGVVSTLWTDPGNLQGFSKPENTKVYEICFENLMPAGQFAEVKFQDGPTKIEIIRKGMQKLSMAYANGKITSR